MLVEILSWFCFLAGSFLCISGSVGILRLPDFFSRLHASSVTETLATPLLLTGVMLQTDWSLDTLKLMMVGLFVLFTNPTATHAMVKAALHDGQTPLEFDEPIDHQNEDHEAAEEESSTS
ncbi:MAG: monovalent cation/H(+) antiporter subunit G [Planctomycetes bacterium]|nr:monovalent cation/H(+) antiporter subunit G [Planctomycetota bacterium]